MASLLLLHKVGNVSVVGSKAVDGLGITCTFPTHMSMTELKT